MNFKLNVPYFSQLDNRFDWWRTCNITCIAMCLAAYGIVGDGSQAQLEDQLYVYANDPSRRLVIGLPEDMKKIVEWKPGCHDTMTRTGTMQTLIDALKAHHPCILHTYLTKSGHVIAPVGLDEERRVIYCHDPNGEWNATGYTHQPGAGKFVPYSYNLIQRVADIGGMWIHDITRDGHTVGVL